METKKIKINQLYWILPLTLLMGFIIGMFFMGSGITYMYNQYSMIECIYQLEDTINPNTNNIPFTTESQRAAIQWRCAKEHINFNVTDYEELFELK